MLDTAMSKQEHSKFASESLSSEHPSWGPPCCSHTPEKIEERDGAQAAERNFSVGQFVRALGCFLLV